MDYSLLELGYSEHCLVHTLFCLVQDGTGVLAVPLATQPPFVVIYCISLSGGVMLLPLYLQRRKLLKEALQKVMLVTPYTWRLLLDTVHQWITVPEKVHQNGLTIVQAQHHSQLHWKEDLGWLIPQIRFLLHQAWTLWINHMMTIQPPEQVSILVVVCMIDLTSILKVLCTKTSELMWITQTWLISAQIQAFHPYHQSTVFHPTQAAAGKSYWADSINGTTRNKICIVTLLHRYTNYMYVHSTPSSPIAWNQGMHDCELYLVIPNL